MKDIATQLKWVILGENGPAFTINEAAWLMKSKQFPISKDL